MEVCLIHGIVGARRHDSSRGRAFAVVTVTSKVSILVSSAESLIASGLALFLGPLSVADRGQRLVRIGERGVRAPSVHAVALLRARQFRVWRTLLSASVVLSPAIWSDRPGVAACR